MFRFMVLSLGLCFLAGCEHTMFKSRPRVILPDTPPLSAEVLEQTAGTCAKEVEGLRSRSPYVPEERRSEFRTVLNLADNNCSDLRDTLERLKRAAHQEQSLRQNLEHARSTMLPGSIEQEPSQGNKKTNVTPDLGEEVNQEPL